MEGEGKVMDPTRIETCCCFLISLFFFQLLFRCIGVTDDPGVLLAPKKSSRHKKNVLIASCTSVATQEKEYRTTIRVNFQASTCVIQDCSNCRVLIDSIAYPSVLYLVRCRQMRVVVAGDLPHVYIDSSFDCAVVLQCMARNPSVDQSLAQVRP